MTIPTDINIGELAYWNEWWKTGAFPADDANLSDWSASSFKWRPRLNETIENKEVIYILRGPRRVGKTTLIKLRIRSLLESGINPTNILYFPCDAVETPKQLVTVIDNYLNQQRIEENWSYLFIDEISTLKDWQKSIKLLIDAGRFRNCTVILTGSHSLDLRVGAESLAGRRGKVETLRYGTPDKILLSAKFAEYVETINPTLANEIKNLRLLSLDNRKRMFLELANGRMPSEISRLLVFTKELNVLLDQYMLTGGISQATTQYISSRKIAEDTYFMFVNLVIREICKWGYDQHNARQVLRRLFEVQSSGVSWNSLKVGTDIKDPRTVESYVNILRDSFVVTYFYKLDTNKSSPDFQDNKKIYFQDPFIFHGCRAWTYGKQAFDLGVKLLGSTEEKSKMVEGVVGTHLARFMFSNFPGSLYDSSNYVFYWINEKKKEVDFVFELDGRYLPIEVKYSDDIQKGDIKGLFDFMKTGRSHNYGIVASRSQAKINDSFVVIPVSILLLLI